MTIAYKPEIDGLRAVAVTLVVLFHAGIPGFQGGFIGVDIFFVISGFLITSIIASDLKQGNFSFVAFYQKRLRRLFPALFLVLCVVFCFGWFVLLPEDFRSLGKSLIYQALLLPNLFFAKEVDYFATSADLHPLLHTWSLGIEEQFYLIFPLLLFCLSKKLSNRLVMTFLFLLVLIGLTYSTFLNDASRHQGFYSFPARFWELMLGCLVALIPVDKIDIAKKYPRLVNYLITSGIVCFILIFYLIERESKFYGIYALPLLILVSVFLLFPSRFGLLSSVFGSHFFVTLGLISYPVYLWHQPIFAYSRHLSILGESVFSKSLHVFLAFAIGYMTYKFWELPIRKNINISLLVKVAIVFGLLCLLGGSYIRYQNGLPERLDLNGQNIYAYLKYDIDDAYRLNVCFLGLNSIGNEFSRECLDGADTFLVGDSLAAGLFEGVKKSSSRISQYTVAGCSPFEGAGAKTDKRCALFRRYINDLIKDKQPARLIFHANWSAYGDVLSFEQNLMEFYKSLQNLSPQTKIIVLGSLPQWSPSLPGYLIRNHPLIDVKYIALPTNMTRLKEEYSRLASNSSYRYRFVSPFEFMCDVNAGCVTAVAEGDLQEPLVWDYGHLTRLGSAYVGERLSNLIFLRDQ